MTLEGLNAFAILPPADAADLHSKYVNLSLLGSRTFKSLVLSLLFPHRISHHSTVERIHAHPGFWSFECDTAWPLSLNLEGTSITVPPTGLNLGRVSPGSNRCVSGIIGSDTPGRAVFGIQAMQRYVVGPTHQSRRKLTWYSNCSMRTFFDVGRGQIGLDLTP